jgi:hypothetical protein
VQIAHGRGWWLAQLPHVDGKDNCFRLYRADIWMADCGSAALPDQLSRYGLLLADFGPVEEERCISVDLGSRLACPRLAEPVDGQAHLPLCGSCRKTLAGMSAFPGQRDIHSASTAVPHLTAIWHGLNDEHGMGELSHRLRHPVAKILGWAEILRDDDSVDPSQASPIEVIYRCASELRELLDSVNSPL